MFIATSAAFKAKTIGVDGDVGSLVDIFFDDQTWSIRYLVIDTGSWLSMRKTLIAPAAVETVDWNHLQLRLNLTKEQIESSPPIEKHKPVSQRLLETIHGHYGWPIYPPAVPGVPVELQQDIADKIVENDGHGPNLRSVNEVTGYHIEATDGEIGHVEEFILNDELWELRYVIVDTRNWLPGKKVVVDPRWAESIDWHERKFHLEITKEKVKHSPEFDPATPINRQFEKQVYDFHGRPSYWQI